MKKDKEIQSLKDMLYDQKVAKEYKSSKESNERINDSFDLEIVIQPSKASKKLQS